MIAIEPVEEGVRGLVVWGEAADHRFRLTVAPDSRVTELVVTAPDGGAISSRKLREIPIVRMQRAISQKVEEQAELDAAELDTLQVPPGRPDLTRGVADRRAYLTARAAAWPDFTERPGRPGRPDVEYARVAALYVKCVRDDPRPIDALKSELDRLARDPLSHLSKSSVRNLVSECRRRGLLTKVGQGRAGGQLTTKAKELLRAER